MITPDELGIRLRQARERAGRTQEEAATRLGLDATAIVKIEHGRRGVGAIELKQLAALYGVSANALLEDAATDGGEIKLHVALRIGEATNRGAAELVERLERIIADDRWLRERVGDDKAVAGWKPLALPARQHLSGYERGYRAGNAFRTHYALGASPIRDMSLLADEVGVLVARLPLGKVNVPDGCSAIDPVGGCAYILINSDKPRVRRRFTIAHELGHLALGHLKAGDLVLDGHLAGANWQEIEANAFAAGVLMPTEGVRGALARLQARLGKHLEPLSCVVWLAESFGVSEEAAAYRLANLGLRTDQVADTEQKADAVVQPAKDDGVNDVTEAIRALKNHPEALRRVRMELGLAPVMTDAERGVTEVGPAMRARVVKALEAGLIAVERAASMLHVPVNEAYRWIAESGINVGNPPQSCT